MQAAAAAAAAAVQHLFLVFRGLGAVFPSPVRSGTVAAVITLDVLEDRETQPIPTRFVRKPNLSQPVV